MSLKAFSAELKKGLPLPVYLLHAEDASVVREAVSLVRESVPDEERDFRYRAFDLEAEAVPVERIIEALRTVPFFGGRQTVVVEGLQKLLVEGLDVLKPYVNAPLNEAVLVLFYTGKVKKATSERLSAAKAIPLMLRESDLPGWIIERGKSRSVEISTDAAAYLIETIGPDIGLLGAEVEKIASMGQKKVTERDIEAITKGSGNANAFELADALLAGNADEAFRTYAALSEGGSEAYNLMGALNWRFSMAKLPPRKKEKIIRLLSEADLMIKSTGGTYPLEHLFVKLLRA